jgi:hypothetical protein
MQAAHGNTPMSLLLTVVTNMLGAVTVPYLLKLLVGNSSVRHLKYISFCGEHIHTYIRTTCRERLRARSDVVELYVPLVQHIATVFVPCLYPFSRFLHVAAYFPTSP